eukprot:scaffold1225_cov164-Amphora_coffeaeformis.AAC.4
MPKREFLYFLVKKKEGCFENGTGIPVVDKMAARIEQNTDPCLRDKVRLHASHERSRRFFCAKQTHFLMMRNTKNNKRIFLIKPLLSECATPATQFTNLAVGDGHEVAFRNNNKD